jgi:hypothetical protein
MKHGSSDVVKARYDAFGRSDVPAVYSTPIRSRGRMLPPGGSS